MYSECLGCIGLASDILAHILQRYPTIEESVTWCGNESNFYFNLTDNAYIVSKLPIINTWSFILPSWLFTVPSVQIAQINICSETDPKNAKTNCADSIIVGCTHLEPSDFSYDRNVLQNPLDNTLSNITSHIGLNRMQT
eukprot:65263_1